MTDFELSRHFFISYCTSERATAEDILARLVFRYGHEMTLEVMRQFYFSHCPTPHYDIRLFVNFAKRYIAEWEKSQVHTKATAPSKEKTTVKKKDGG